MEKMSELITVGRSYEGQAILQQVAAGSAAAVVCECRRKFHRNKKPLFYIVDEFGSCDYRTLSKKELVFAAMMGLPYLEPLAAEIFSLSKPSTEKILQVAASFRLEPLTLEQFDSGLLLEK